MDDAVRPPDFRAVAETLRILARTTEAHARALSAAARAFESFGRDLFAAGIVDSTGAQELTVGPMTIDMEQRTLSAHGKTVDVPKKLLAILFFFAERKEMSVTHERLAVEFWPDRGPDQAQASVRQAMSDLRQLLKDMNCQAYLHKRATGKYLLSDTPAQTRD